MPPKTPHPGGVPLDRRARRAWFWRWWSVFMLVFGLYALVLWLFTTRDVPRIWWTIAGWGVLPVVAFALVLWVGRGVWRTGRQRALLAGAFALGWVVAASAREAAVWWITGGLAALAAGVAAIRWARRTRRN